MPIYCYKCASCKTVFDRFLPLDKYDEAQTCNCGQPAEKILTPVMVRGDYAGYTCPITNKWVEGRRAHKENLAKHGCRVLEPGERENVHKYHAQKDKELDSKVDETVERFVAGLPEQKRTELFNEVAAGATAVIERK